MDTLTSASSTTFKDRDPGDEATGQIYPTDEGNQVLTSKGDDVVPGADWKVTWKAHPSLNLMIRFDDAGLLETVDGRPVRMPIRVKAGETNPKVYVLTNRECDASYFYDAMLVTPKKSRRRCLNGQSERKDEKENFADTATRPRIRVGSGGFLPKP